MKNKILKETRGAVAIFLVIILVPMMTVSCLFVDISRVKLAKALVDSAGDLTLNSALTQYDSLLQEYYGLFATSQSIDETLAKMDEYFIKCIKSAGLSDDDAQLYSKKLIGSFTSGSDESITDFLNIIVNPADFEMKRTPGGSICNPTLLKSQIVNFMKYRAPINGGLSLISSLKSFSNLSKETELIDKRKEYYEAEEAVNTDCKEAWNNINSYNSLSCGKDTEYYNTLWNKFTTNNGGSKDEINYKKRYQKIIEAAMQYVYISNNKNTGDNLSFANNVTSQKFTVKEYKSGQTTPTGTLTWKYIGESAYTNEGYLKTTYKNISYKVTKDSNNSKITVNTTSEAELEAAIKTAQDKLTKLNKEANSFSTGLKKDEISNTRYVYYCVEKSGNYRKAAEEFSTAMQTLEHRYKWVANPDIVKNYTTIDGKAAPNGYLTFTTDDLKNRYSCGGSTKSLNEWYSHLTGAYRGTNGSFTKYCTFAEDLGTEAKKALTTYGDQLNYINNELGKISADIEDYKKTLQDASGFLKNASNSLSKISNAVASGGALTNAKDNWSSSANGIGDSSSIAAQDKAEIANIAKQFKKEDIDKLKNRIDSIKTNIDSLVKEFDKYKFGNKKLEEITDYKVLRNQIHTLATNSGGEVINPQSGGNNGTPCSKQTITYQANTLMQKGYQTGNVDINWVKQASSNPYLKQQILNFYIYLYKNFNETGDYNKITDKDNNSLKEENSDLKKNKDSAIKNIENEGSEDKEKASEKNCTSKSPNVSDQSKLPSKSPIEKIDGSQSSNQTTASEKNEMGDTDSSGAAKKASESTSNLFKDVGKWLTDMGSALRDNIYMTEYVMDMFSYDTIEKTGNSNSKKSGETYPELKSLTCEGINANNNFAYRSEVEYILYGGSNTSNVATAYATIYGIRLAFNLIYAFTNSELKMTSLAIATPLSAATCGIVPVPLIQYGLLAACALAESGIDIANLKLGEKVPLYKTDQTWNLSLSNAMSSIIDGAANGVRKVGESVINKGVDKIGELLDKSEEELNSLNDEAINDINSQIEGAYNNVFDEQINAVSNELSSLITSSIQNSANDKGDFNIQNATDYVVSNLKKWRDNDDSTGLVKQIRNQAINYLLQNPNLITSLINEFNKSGTANTVASNLQDKLSGLLDDLKKSVRKNLNFNKQIEDAKESIKGSVKQGAEGLKKSLNGMMDKLSGSSDLSGEKSPTSATASIFSFDYRDFLKLFLLIKFMINGETTLLRTADVIQVNMAKVSGNSSYRLKNSSCYLTLDCKTYVKPLFLAIPLIADTASISTNGGNGKRTFCFEYHYKKTKGY